MPGMTEDEAIGGSASSGVAECGDVVTPWTVLNANVAGIDHDKSVNEREDEGPIREPRSLDAAFHMETRARSSMKRTKPGPLFSKQVKGARGPLVRRVEPASTDEEMPLRTTDAEQAPASARDTGKKPDRSIAADTNAVVLSSGESESAITTGRDTRGTKRRNRRRPVTCTVGRDEEEDDDAEGDAPPLLQQLHLEGETRYLPDENEDLRETLRQQPSGDLWSRLLAHLEEVMVVCQRSKNLNGRMHGRLKVAYHGGREVVRELSARMARIQRRMEIGMATLSKDNEDTPGVAMEDRRDAAARRPSLPPFPPPTTTRTIPEFDDSAHPHPRGKSKWKPGKISPLMRGNMSPDMYVGGSEAAEVALPDDSDGEPGPPVGPGMAMLADVLPIALRPAVSGQRRVLDDRHIAADPHQAEDNSGKEMAALCRRMEELEKQLRGGKEQGSGVSGRDQAPRPSLPPPPPPRRRSQRIERAGATRR